MTQLKRLLEPGLIGKMRVKNRVSMAPMERSLGNKDGSITQWYIGYLVERAKNGVGMITVEATYIDVGGRGHFYQLGLSDDSVITSHRRMTDALHKYDVRVSSQIYHAGRATSIPRTGRQLVAPSPLPCMVTGGDMPRELSKDEIKGLVIKFGDAARRAKEAGYDMVTVHGAHGYVIGAFASPFTNRRSDEYGGTFENRMRFPLEVLSEVRAVVGSDFPVGYRISADEFVDGGLTLDDNIQIARRLEEAGLDFLDVSAAIYESRAMMFGYMDMPLGYLVYLAAAMKEALKIPVICTGRINDMVFAEGILEKNQADFVHMVRAFHADPEILAKSQQGKFDDVCTCMACNKCLDMIRQNLPTICAVNPSATREREFVIKPAKNKKKVTVIGGGVAGMEAARVARLRGHDVTLYEKEGELGGQVRWASKTKYREDIFQAARYRIHEVKRTGVKVELGQEVTLAQVDKLNPEVVVVASGAVPVAPAIPGIDRPLVCTPVDILSGERKPGKNCLVIGGNKVGLTVAEFLADNGSRVTIVEAADVLLSDMVGFSQMRVSARIGENPMIETRLKSTVEHIEDGSVTLQSEGEFERLTGIDQVVVAWDRISVNQLADDIISQGKIPEVYTIGDALMPREITEAIYEGALIGRKI